MERSLNPFEPQFARIHSGELRLRASKEASSLPMLPLKPALDGWTVMRNARERVEVLGGPAAVRNYKNVLSQHILQFGKYRGQTFKWVLENDLGWVTGVLATVACAGEKEEGTPLSQNKFRLLQYVKMYPHGPRDPEGEGGEAKGGEVSGGCQAEEGKYAGDSDPTVPGASSEDRRDGGPRPGCRSTGDRDHGDPLGW